MDALTSVGRPSVYSPSAGLQRGSTSTVNVSQSLSTDISFVTAEGDKVTISSSMTDRLDLATYNSEGRLNASATSRSTQELSLTVEGNLSERELEDIQGALEVIQQATQDAIEGNGVDVAAQVRTLSGLDQIASMTAAIRFQSETSISQVTEAPERRKSHSERENGTQREDRIRRQGASHGHHRHHHAHWHEAGHSKPDDSNPAPGAGRVAVVA